MGRPASFKHIMAVKQTAPDTFESLLLAWEPGIVANRTFGGHVFSQAVYSASKTCGKGMVVHNVTGHFVLPGSSQTPFVYRVRRIRDGGVYCIRSVDVYQKETETPMRIVRTADTPCFVCTISFKRDESGNTKWADIGHQDAPVDHVQTMYASVLNGIPNLADHPRSPSADADWWLRVLGDKWIDAAESFPGVEIHKVDMKKYNGVVEEGGGGRTGDYRQLCFYRVIQDEEAGYPEGAFVHPDQETDDANLTACVHIYASDRNSLFLIQRALGYQNRQTSMGSLAHTVILHGPTQYQRLTDASGKPKWFVQEAHTSNSGAGRGCHESRLWDFEAGRILATTVQDGMIRIAKHDHAAGDMWRSKL